MVISDVITARILEKQLTATGFKFCWFLKSTHGYSAADRLDGVFHANHEETHKLWTQGIDKKHNVVLCFMDNYQLSFILIIKAEGNYTNLLALLRKLGIDD